MKKAIIDELKDGSVWLALLIFLLAYAIGFI